jgi:hypothetical protein
MKLKAFVKAPGAMSRAMFRVEKALTRYAPRDVEIVQRAKDADVQILHVIGGDALSYQSDAARTAAIQYCVSTAGGGDWQSFWSRQLCTWSYYDLHTQMPHDACFYHAPLGLDDAFKEPILGSPLRPIGVITSGYVTGPGAEAILEVAIAAHAAGLRVMHIGPKPVPTSLKTKIDMPPGWRNVEGVSDDELANLYRSARWVSGLRFVEGFELPVIEGLACGARPIVFERADMRQWYSANAVFVPEAGNLVEALTGIFSEQPDDVTAHERAEVIAQFNWKPIIEDFWTVVLARVS